jgi:hypothetical protein
MNQFSFYLLGHITSSQVQLELWVRQVLGTANAVPRSPLLVTLMKENVGSYKSHTANIPEDAFFIVTAVKTSNLT